MDEWLTVADLAEELRVPVPTIYAWNHNRTGPRAHKVGRHLRYRRADLNAWLEQQVVGGAA